MWLVNLRRVIQSGFNNFWRSPVVSLASVLTLTVTLFVFGSLVLGAAFLDSTLANIQDKVDISVTFLPDASEESVLALKEAVALLPEVAAVEYISREEELALFTERHKDNSLIIQSLEEVGNPFGARLNIKATDPSQYESVANFLGNRAGDGAAATDRIIDSLSFKKDIVEKLLKVISSSRKMAVAVSVVLVVISILVTVNTISLTIYISKDEISVMRLVGAGDLYVRGPFMVEGIIAGVIAAIVALLLLYPAAVWVRNATSSVYGGIDLVSYYGGHFGQVFLVLLFSGILLGVVASWLAVRKYAKV